MQWAKAKRMWFFYYRGGGVDYISTRCGLAGRARPGRRARPPRRPDPAPRRRCSARRSSTITFSTGIHTIVVSQARYNVPLMPLLVADRGRGWFLALRRAPPSPESERPTVELRPAGPAPA